MQTSLRDNVLTKRESYGLFSLDFCERSPASYINQTRVIPELCLIYRATVSYHGWEFSLRNILIYRCPLRHAISFTGPTIKSDSRFTLTLIAARIQTLSHALSAAVKSPHVNIYSYRTIEFCKTILYWSYLSAILPAPSFPGPLTIESYHKGIFRMTGSEPGEDQEIRPSTISVLRVFI